MWQTIVKITMVNTNLTKLNLFLFSYQIKVADMVKLSGQSPQTLRNWYNQGEVTDKSFLILCLVAAYKWRAYQMKPLYDTEPFIPNLPLKLHIKPRHMQSDDLQQFSHQSGQTLRNWMNSPDKQIMINVLIDAVCWYRFAIENKMLGVSPSFQDYALALKMPIPGTEKKVKFVLTDFVKKTNRREVALKANELKR